MSENENTCLHSNSTWAPLHECHWCNNCNRWFYIDYTKNKVQTRINGKWVESEHIEYKYNEK